MIKWWKLRASSIHVQVSSMSEKAQDIPRLVGSFCSLYFFPFIIQKTFDQCSNLGICPLFFSTVFYTGQVVSKTVWCFTMKIEKWSGLLIFSKAWFEFKSFFSHDPLGSHHCIRAFESRMKLRLGWNESRSLGLTFATWNDARCFFPWWFFHDSTMYLFKFSAEHFCDVLWWHMSGLIQDVHGFLTLGYFMYFPRVNCLWIGLCSSAAALTGQKVGSGSEFFGNGGVHPESTSPKLQTWDFL